MINDWQQAKWLGFEGVAPVDEWGFRLCSIPMSAAILGAGALGGLGSLVSGIFGSDAATSAANLQARSAQQALQLQLAMFQQYQGQLSPFRNVGINALSELSGATTGIPIDASGNALGLANPSLTNRINPIFQAGNIPYSTMTGTGAGGNTGGVAFNPSVGLNWQPTMAQLAQTPGYQFTLGQGLQATQNSYAAQGLGSSGPALKGAANYAEGLASTTYQQQFQNYLSQLQNQYNIYSGVLGQQQGQFNFQNQFGLGQNQQIYNMLGALAGSGQNASVNLGTGGLSIGASGANLLTSAGAAGAGGIVGSTNALTAGFSGLTNSLGNAGINSLLLPALLGNNTNNGSGSNPLNLLLAGQGPGTGGNTGTGLYGY